MNKNDVFTPRWLQCERISNLPPVDEALRAFSEDPTADNATGIVVAVLESSTPAAPVVAEGDEMPRSEQVLRRLLAYRCAGSNLYADDGELQDNTAHPLIDFKRDTVDTIECKLGERTRAVLAANPVAGSPAEAEDVSYELIQNDELVASTSGQGAWAEIQHYATQYEQDGPVEIIKCVRTPAAAAEPMPASEAPAERSLGRDPEFVRVLQKHGVSRAAELDIIAMVDARTATPVPASEAAKPWRFIGHRDFDWLERNDPNKEANPAIPLYRSGGDTRIGLYLAAPAAPTDAPK